ncbi:MAG: hypothetical protein N2V75_03810 [Methanophagales archaeon]|nr:hypothetical protein [Methanophagales archaeon]
MTRVCVDLETGLHRAVKMRAIEKGLTMKEFIRGVLQDYVREHGSRDPVYITMDPGIKGPNDDEK